MHVDEVLWDVVEEHLDEAEFLWSAWERGLTAPNLTLARLASGTEARLQAHVDGLVIAGKAAVERLLAPALRDFNYCRAAAATWGWLAIAGDAGVGPLCEHLIKADPPECRGIARGLGLYEGEVIAAVTPLLTAEAAAVQAAALAVFAAKRRSPGPVLAELAGQWFREAGPQRLACVPLAVPAALLAGLAGELGAAGYDLALWTGLRRGFGPAREAVWRAAGRRSGALALGACGGERGLAALLAELGGAGRAAALWGLGFTGRRQAADACVEWLGHAELGGLAAESLAAISGLDLEAERMTVRAVPEDPEEEEVPEAGPDEGLALPDAPRVKAWWLANRGRFAAERRYLLGEPVTTGGVAAGFERVAMRRRPGLALEVAMRTHDRVVVEVAGFSAQQRRSVAGLAGLAIDWRADALE